MKRQARVHAVGHECDLAVLTVDDPAFWVDATVAPRADDASSDAGAVHSGAVRRAAPKNGSPPREECALCLWATCPTCRSTSR